MKHLIKFGKNDLPFIVVEAAAKGQQEYAKEFIGIGFEDFIVHFDGDLMYSFRTEEDIALFKERIIPFCQSEKFESGLEELKKISGELLDAIEERKELWVVCDLFSRSYALFLPAYLISTFWMDGLSKEDRESILKTCGVFRVLNDKVKGAFVEYVLKSISEKGVSKLSNIEEFRLGSLVQEKKEGFIFHNGQTHFNGFKEFLRTNGFSI